MAKLLTTQRAADYLGLATSVTLFQWREKGYGPPYIRTPGACLYSTDDLDEFIATNRNDPRARNTPPRHRIKWNGFTDAQWSAVVAALKATASGRRALGLRGDLEKTRATLTRLFLAAAVGKWPAKASRTDIDLNSLHQEWTKRGLLAVIFETLENDPDWPFSLAIATLIVASPRHTDGRRLLPLHVDTIGRLSGAAARLTLTYRLDANTPV